MRSLRALPAPSHTQVLVGGFSATVVDSVKSIVDRVPLMIGILVISGFVSRVMLKKLQIRRNLPPRAVVGEPMTVYYEVSNTKRYWPSLSVSQNGAAPSEMETQITRLVEINRAYESITNIMSQTSDLSRRSIRSPPW